MQIVIIGTGNAAFVLGRKLKRAGHSIIQVFGRDSMEASKLAYELDTRSTNYWNVINKNARSTIAVKSTRVEDFLLLTFPPLCLPPPEVSNSAIVLSLSSCFQGGY